MLSNSELCDLFTHFIESIPSDNPGGPKYEEAMSSMVVNGQKSLVVDFSDIYDFNEELAAELIDSPHSVLEQFRYATVLKLNSRYGDYASQAGTINIRVRGLPGYTSLRDIGQPEQIGKFIMVNGFVTQIGVPKPLLIRGCWTCDKCSAENLRIQNDQFQKPPNECSACNSRRGFTLNQLESKWVLSQVIMVQERPETLTAGQLPRPFKLVLYGDLVESVHPGDRVTATGTLNLIRKTVRGGLSRTYNLEFRVNHIDVMYRNMELIEISKADEKIIKKLAEDPLIDEKIIDSIAPAIYGRRTIKQAIAYYLFGGTQKVLPDTIIRDWLNVLLVGDPGTGKSQLLEAALRVASRAMSASGGKHASGVGLTASMVKVDGEFMLSPGALALCDLGYVMLDELDKIDEKETQALHRPMEQGDLPIAKGGMTTVLNARTAILAAANPTLGRYNTYQTVAENINLPTTLLSRFDLIFIIKDLPDREEDEKLSRHLSSLHRGVNPQKPPIDQKMLMKYIIYARRKNPVLTEDLDDAIAQFYVKTRNASAQSTESPIAISPRNQESLIRMAESRARMFLRDELDSLDIKAAVELMMVSLNQIGIDPQTGELDIDVIYSGQPRSLQLQMQLVLGVIGEMSRETGIVKDDDLFDELSGTRGISKVEAARIIGVLMRDGTIYSPRPGFYKRTTGMHIPIKPQEKPKEPEPKIEPAIEPPEETKTTEKGKPSQEDLDRVFGIVYAWKDGLHTDKVASELGIDRNEALRLLNQLKENGMIFQPKDNEGWWKA